MQNKEYKMEKSLEQYLYESFGYETFRKGQKEIIETLIKERRDVCCVMATGQGKSVCYQLPAVVTGKVSVVVSPLLSLMEDQRVGLEKKGITACCFSSSLSNIQQMTQDIFKGQYKVIYITPEAINTNTSLLTLLDQYIGIGIIAIDEAHCISLWGNSFRPSYTELARVKMLLPHVPVLALTGTATPQVENDIIRLLHLNNPLRVRTSADRKNLSYYVHAKGDPADNLFPLLKQGESAIVYCPTRGDTEHIAQILDAKIASRAYHAGLSAGVRNDIHHAFLKQEITCIVATVCFGMGIDKPDIRKVIHYGCPKDMESYCQEVGRAGRDGLPSTCHVFFSPSDFATNRYFLRELSDPVIRGHRENMVHAIEKFLYLTTCRREFMLQYFGETVVTKPPLCCDNCVQPIKAKTVDIGPDVKMFLGLLRDHPNKFGRLIYIGIIRGSNNKKIPHYMKNSPWFGMGVYHSVEWWKTCVQYLINDKLIVELSKPGAYGYVIGLGEKGRDWLFSQNSSDPHFLVTESSLVLSLSEAEPSTKETKSKTRRRKAPLETLPIITPDSSTYKPSIALPLILTHADMTSTSIPISATSDDDIPTDDIPDVLPFLQLTGHPPQSCNETPIQPYIETRNISSIAQPIIETETVPLQLTIKAESTQKRKKSEKKEKKSEKGLSATVAETYHMFQEEDKTVEEIALLRKLNKTTVENHIAECIKAKVPLSPNKIPLTSRLYQTIIAIVQSDPINGDTSKLAPIKNLCPKSTSYHQLKCALAVREAGLADHFGLNV